MRLSNPEQLGRILERVCLVLEEELGDDISAWTATIMVLLQTIADAANVDIKEVAAVLAKSHEVTEKPPIH